MNLAAKLTSRKFLVTIGTVIGLIGAKQHTEAAALAAAYVLGEAHIDAKDVASASRTANVFIERVIDNLDEDDDTVDAELA